MQTTVNSNALELTDGECRKLMRQAPHLAMDLHGLTDHTDKSGQRDLEEAVRLGYNNFSKDCLDRYHRWMYNVRMANQTLVLNSSSTTGGHGNNTISDGYLHTERLL
jgi:hypothetical protein